MPNNCKKLLSLFSPLSSSSLKCWTTYLITARNFLASFLLLKSRAAHLITATNLLAFFLRLRPWTTHLITVTFSSHGRLFSFYSLLSILDSAPNNCKKPPTLFSSLSYPPLKSWMTCLVPARHVLVTFLLLKSWTTRPVSRDCKKPLSFSSHLFIFYFLL